MSELQNDNEKIQVKDISSFLEMALSLLYSKMEREGDSREEGFYGRPSPPKNTRMSNRSANTKMV